MKPTLKSPGPKKNLGNKVNLDKLVARREFDDSTNEESKRPKTDIGSVRKPIVEIEMFKSNDSVQLTQSGAYDDKQTQRNFSDQLFLKRCPR